MKTQGASVVLTLALWSETLLAQPAQWPIYVSARLPPVCQGVTDFAQRLLSRTNRLRWAYAGEAGIVFDVSAQQFSTGLVGQLQIRELSGRFTQRSVEGTNCDGVLDALAFVAAVLVDNEPEPAPPQPMQAVIPPLPVQPEPPAPPGPPEPPAPPGPPTRFAWGVGVTTGLTSATSPAIAQPSLGLRASLAWTNRYFDPWVTLGFEQRFDSTVHSTFGLASVDTSFGGWSAHVALSPIRWPSKGNYLLRPVAVFEVGQLTSTSANGQNLAMATPTSTRTWLASGLGATAEAAILSPIAVVADVCALVPWKHLDYWYGVGSTESHVFTVPSVGVSLRLGVIVKFK